MTLPELNQLPLAPLKESLRICCGSTAWVDQLASVFPVPDRETLFEQAEVIWFGLDESDWREAFEHHPKIGDLNSLREKYANTKAWASGEQAGVSTASSAVLDELADGNRQYEAKFGYIFIVCATGKSAKEMLAILKNRLSHLPEDEIQVAAQEQQKITQLRLEKLLAT